MSALTDLQTAYQTQINSITNAIAKAKANLLLQSLISAYEQHASLESGKIQSYSIGNRSFTFRDIEKSEKAVNQIESKLNRLLSGTVSLVDLTG